METRSATKRRAMEAAAELDLSWPHWIWLKFTNCLGCGKRRPGDTFSFYCTLLLNVVIVTLFLQVVLYETNFFEELSQQVTGQLPPTYSSEKVSSHDVWAWMNEHHAFILMICPSFGAFLYFTLGDRSCDPVVQMQPERSQTEK